MIFFDKNKNESIEFKSLKEYKKNIDYLLSKDDYISRKEYIAFYNENINIFEKLKIMNDELVLESWCKNNKDNFNELKELIDFYNNTNEIIKQHNDNFINQHLKNDKQYLDNILEKDDPNISLDEEQRKVVLSDEDYTLVIAGAGAGKTTTIEAKVKYLVEKKNIDPNRILVISFTRKATNELQTRFKKLDIPVMISTFHSIFNKKIHVRKY